MNGPDAPQLDIQEQEADAISRDISLIAVGATQENRSKFTAGRMTVNDDSHSAAAQRQQEQDKERAEQQRIAAWDAERIMVGGVLMTNAEAQEAREKILNDPDRWSKWARDQGLIKEGEEGEFNQAAQTIYNNKKIEHDTGQLTPEQQAELDAALASRFGQAAEKATAAANQEARPSLKTGVSAAASADTKPIFPSAPDVGGSFAVASSDQAANTGTPAPAAPALKREVSGLNL
ncbi:hypothetical protein [Caballeronia sp. AZ7_KS35]|uniref:hypothetical protein n=1 Tax=Caballeronia sp. AZ7_KS35 TaxID=2921762 RepID=UPI0020288B7F|nr:hypothetical protein [Caballeronia sp. AZ7_KS35]